MDKHEILAYRSLLRAILFRAALDYLGSVHTFGEAKSVANHWRRNARAWLFGKSENVEINPDPFTFMWVCEALDLDPEKFRASIEKITQLPSQTRYTMLVEQMVEGDDSYPYELMMPTRK